MLKNSGSNFYNWPIFMKKVYILLWAFQPFNTLLFPTRYTEYNSHVFMPKQWEQVE